MRAAVDLSAARPAPQAGPPPRRVLMTLDAVGGVWRYAVDLATALTARGTEFVFVGLGPAPGRAQLSELDALGSVIWLDAPLDWMVDDETELDHVPRLIAEVADRFRVELIHANLPSQVARLDVRVPVVAVTHSCVVTWFRAVRGTDVPDGWRWQVRCNRRGFEAADVVVAPSQAHARLTQTCYGLAETPRVVHNTARPAAPSTRPLPIALAAGRWWDDGKNAGVLDAAAALAETTVEMAGPLRGPNGQQTRLEYARHVGEMDNSALRRLMSRRAIYCSPSIYEPFGLAPLEAAHCGAALVLSDIATFRELWDGAALFAAPDDPAGFARAIDQLVAKPDARAALATAAGRRAVAFGPHLQAEAMAEVYRRAATRHAATVVLAS